MSTPSDDALLKELEARELPDIQSLANLYDSFANALDPFSERRDLAEKLFTEEVARLYDDLKYHFPKTQITFQVFRRALITKCKKHLAAQNKPPSV